MSERRLLKEYQVVKKELGNHKNIISSLEPIDSDDLTNWTATILGPPNTPYHGHSFDLRIHLTPEYPLKPPQVTFSAYKMPHCNIEFKTGKICLNILDNANWSPVWNLLTVVLAIYQLLSDPVTDSPLNIDLSNILKIKDTSAYYGLIEYYLNNKSDK
ncbi:hypothetical protein Kpol_480p13 [Vanderwaltozyma polyspora DSM 70294]|uniref:UBC core domain-containing protein n=1 Tax=Vanderwaltozyma polyspora (strain ATCC 22028 / DSM 70294 / BCRC 21397 / CBS 2163 / NBRC 10782 / NRRL Y-8283 / UCD 57-17) TaxID=436907 RepID=A7TP75_VANPO|nr:uncharacterized protein Kpol_480p13 [Vanderwaltozyma polyspora DSM 70294]EDO15926.1 hypothetical protein Kpol_480p13 [Vanderwaltozyma polyspora DSM 70294]